MNQDPVATHVDNIASDLQDQMRQLASNGAPLSQDLVDAIEHLVTLKCGQIGAATASSPFRPAAPARRMLELPEKFLQHGDISRAIRNKTI